jgi:hypothetical protein
VRSLQLTVPVLITSHHNIAIIMFHASGIGWQSEDLQERRGEAIGKLAKIISGWIDK